MEIYYCDKWSNIKKPWNIIDENAAKTLHENRHSYTAVLSDGEQPKYLVNVTEKWVSVSFWMIFFVNIYTTILLLKKIIDYS